MSNSNGPTRVTALRGRLLWYRADPETEADAVRFHADGLLVAEDGLVRAAGEAAALLPTLPAGAEVVDHRPHLILPGFIDAHIHLPQTEVIASHGAQLLDWLQRYTFPAEARFADPEHAAAQARFFLDELLRNGTTTACVYGSVHPGSVEALLRESERRGTRMIAGKVMMDRGAPPHLLDTAEQGYRESDGLIRRWHGRGRQGYAITPRFAITSTEAQLEAAGALARLYPDCPIQTHIAENRREIETARRLFPWAGDYTAIYERFGLLGPRSLLGHCIHMSEHELQRLHEAGAVAVFCPTSNLFLGSGLFDRWRTKSPRRPVRVALATDVGGGTSYSMLRTAAEGYKVLQLQGQTLTAHAALHALTRGNAAALGLDGLVGGFEPGAECDAVVLDSDATPAMRQRMTTVRSLEEELFVLLTLGDDRAVRAVYVMGRPAHAG